MPDSHVNGTEPEIDAEERTSAIWRAIQRGEAPPSPEAHLIHRLERLATSASPRRSFERKLRETLMDATANRLTGLEPIFAAPRAARLPAPSRPCVPHFRAIPGVFATLALVLAVAGAVIWINLPPSHGDGNLNAGPLPGYITPVANTNPSCLPSDIGGDYAGGEGRMFIPRPPGIASGSLAGTHVQMQKWTIGKGQQYGLDPTKVPAAAGLVVDFVLQGIYSATFGEAVLVVGSDYPNPGVKSVASGTPIELSHGDAVGFPFGTASTITSLGKSADLVFVRSLFLTGDDASALPNREGLTAVQVGTADLPQSIGSIFRSDVGVIHLGVTSITEVSTKPLSLCSEPTVFRVMTVHDPDATVQNGNEFTLWVFPGLG